MRKIMNRVFIALMILQLAACSVLSSNPTKSVNLQFKEPNRISFQGKGAGAGIALMGAMGPVGIALGVAIDEGIAKDIREAVSEEKGDSNKFVTRLVTNQIEAQGYSVALNSKQQTVPVITIKRYGFKIMNGSTDATAAEWDVEIELESGKKVKVQYPKDFNKDSIKTYVLADLKKDGKLGAELLTESLSRVLKRL
jgi:hypothetical protein